MKFAGIILSVLLVQLFLYTEFNNRTKYICLYEINSLPYLYSLKAPGNYSNLPSRFQFLLRLSLNITIRKIRNY